MASYFWGPSRRSYSKSRTGCELCKRRHVRCDERFPQCVNCSKRKTRCPYNDTPGLRGAESSIATNQRDFLWDSHIGSAIDYWRTNSQFPFLSFQVCRPVLPQMYSNNDLGLIYYFASLYCQYRPIDDMDTGSWIQHIPTVFPLATTQPYAWHALCAFSATHLSIQTGSLCLRSSAFEHRGAALSGLCKAIDTFSRDSCDTILVASLLLSWQATDWDDWTRLMQGTLAVFDAISDLNEESPIGDLISGAPSIIVAPLIIPQTSWDGHPPETEG